jgi:nicotinamide-nucleotide amidase
VDFDPNSWSDIVAFCGLFLLVAGGTLFSVGLLMSAILRSWRSSRDAIACGDPSAFAHVVHLPRSAEVGAAMTFSPELAARARETLDALRVKDLTLVTAESCTAGKLTVLLSEVPTAPGYLHGGFVTYTKADRTSALGVSASLLHRKGAVCPAVARAMAEGAVARSPADVAVAITGVAGPEPDEDGIPVGRVCLAVMRRGSPPVVVEKHYGNAGRERIQEQAMAEALILLRGAL